MISIERAIERVEVIENVNAIFQAVKYSGDCTRQNTKSFAWALVAMEPRFNDLDDIRKV
jgi:hypothetical protein